jgi:hypothetical protein
MALSKTAVRKLVNQGVDSGELDYGADVAILSDFVIQDGEAKLTQDVKDALTRISTVTGEYVQKHTPKEVPAAAGKKQSLKIPGGDIRCQLQPGSATKDEDGEAVRKYTLRIFRAGADLKDPDQTFSASFPGTAKDLEADLAPELPKLVSVLSSAIHTYDEADGIFLKYAQLRGVDMQDATARERLNTVYNSQAARRAKLVDVLGEEGWARVKDFGLGLPTRV